MSWKFELDYIFTSKVISDLIYCDFIRIYLPHPNPNSEG